MCQSLKSRLEYAPKFKGVVYRDKKAKHNVPELSIRYVQRLRLIPSSPEWTGNVGRLVSE